MALSAFITLAACDTQGPGFEVFEEIERNRARWAEVGPSSYSYAVERLCFCPIASVPVRVTVSDGVVTDRTFAESGETVPQESADLFPTVDGLFETLLDAVDRDAHSIEVTYDPDTGVPLDVFIDYRHNVADEELGFRVTEAPGG